MPKRRSAWAAWNFCDIKAGENDEEVSLTYNMNILNGIPEEYPLFVTINPARLPQSDCIHGDFNYSHPMHSADVSRAQKLLPSLQGENNTYFCGAYSGYGFHEDGLQSGIDVAESLNVIVPWNNK